MQKGRYRPGAMGEYCSLGERNGALVPIADRAAELGSDALAVIALGTCAAYGGIAAAAPNASQSVSVPELFRSKGINTPLINVPGCPPHPDWFMGTVASVLLMGLPKSEDVDEFGRLKSFYGSLIHENCQRRAYYDEKKFAKKLSDEGCLYELGCKGPLTHADCPNRLWNGGANWCVGCGGMCIGCTQPRLPRPGLTYISEGPGRRFTQHRRQQVEEVWTDEPHFVRPRYSYRRTP